MVTVDEIKKALSEVIDPEIGIDIVSLGLIYEIKIIENEVNVKMTLTVPGCPLGSFILAQVQDKVQEMEGVEKANVELVWDPPWNMDMVSDEAKRRLGII